MFNNKNISLQNLTFILLFLFTALCLFYYRQITIVSTSSFVLHQLENEYLFYSELPINKFDGTLALKNTDFIDLSKKQLLSDLAVTFVFECIFGTLDTGRSEEIQL